MKDFVRISLLSGILTLSLVASAQWDYPQYNMSETTLNVCFGRLYDSGGPTAAYGLNEDITTTIEADGILTMTFFGAFSLQENVDSLMVYDGTEASGTLLGVYSGQDSPGQLVATSGTATLILRSDGSISTAGFSMYWYSEVAMPIPPVLSVPNTPVCQSDQFNIELSNPIPCEWFENAEFNISSGAGTFEVLNVENNCAAGMTEMITLMLDRTLDFNCTILINATMQIPDACGTLHEFELGTSFLFDNCPINAQITSASPAVCPGGCTSVQVNTQGCFNYSYDWSNGLAFTAGPHNVCPATPTTYTVVITELETSQQLTQSITIGIENVEIFTQDQTLCQSAEPVQLQAGAPGVWSGAGISGGVGSFNPDLAGPGSHTVYFNSENCIDSMVFTVTPIASQPVAAACPGTAPFQLNADPAGGTWSGIQVSATGVFDPSIAGTYQVLYVVNGCTDITDVNVAELTGPFTLDPICQSIDIATLSTQPFGGLWTGPGIVNASAGTFNPSNAQPGEVILNYALNGCNADFSIFVKEVNITEAETLCPLESPQVLDATPIPLGGFWSSPDGAITNANTGMFNPGVFSEDTETFITYQALNGCIDTMQISILSPRVEIDEISFCSTNTVVDLNEALVGEAAPSGGFWFGPGVTGSVVDGFALNPQALPIGLSYIYYMANNCEDSVLVRVFSQNLPDAPQNFCASDSPVVLTQTVPGGTWSGSGIVNESTGLFDPSAADIGTYYVYWNNPGGCGDSILITVEEVVEPLISGINDVYCSQDYEVNFSTTPEGGLLVGSLATNTFNPAELLDGEFEVIYKIIPLYCPEVADTAIFTVYPPLALEPLTASDNPVCLEQTTTIVADVNGGYSGNAITYAWSNGGPNASNNTQTYEETTTVSLLVDDGCSDPQTQSIEITLFPRFDYVITTSDTLCPGEEGFIELAITPNGSYEVTWNGEPGADDFYSTLVGVTVDINMTDDNGCEQDTSVSVPAYSGAFAAFNITPDDLCVPFENMGNIEFTSSSLNAFAGLWNFGDGSTEALTTEETITHAYSEPGQYTVSLYVESEGGCADSTALSLCIQPQEPVFVPDIFSPNEDGKNDTLYVRGLFLSRVEFRVYSRWGEVVFESNSPSIGWDGMLRGVPAPSGSYYYTLAAISGGATKIERVGEVVLIR